jgi:hypothetical protein
METVQDTANRHGQRIVITVAKKPHGPGAPAAAQPSKTEAAHFRDLLQRVIRVLRGVEAVKKA